MGIPESVGGGGGDLGDYILKWKIVDQNGVGLSGAAVTFMRDSGGLPYLNTTSNGNWQETLMDGEQGVITVKANKAGYNEGQGVNTFYGGSTTPPFPVETMSPIACSQIMTGIAKLKTEYRNEWGLWLPISGLPVQFYLNGSPWGSQISTNSSGFAIQPNMPIGSIKAYVYGNSTWKTFGMTGSLTLIGGTTVNFVVHPSKYSDH